MHSRKPVICVIAPTASGKTDLAYELYDTGRVEIVSVDSALIYQDMDIGTAKPAAAELLAYPHHLVNIITPPQSYSVATFVQQVSESIEAIHARGKVPLLVGGTMMYFMALIEGMSPVPDSQPDIRAEVEAWRQQEGLPALYDYLQRIDPQLAMRLSANDPQRICRAIEVYRQTGQPLSAWQALPKSALINHAEWQWHLLGLMPDRGWLHERIARRLEIMWHAGLVAEVIHLLYRYDLSRDMTSMRAVGYRQVLNFLTDIEHPATAWLVADQPMTDSGQENVSTVQMVDKSTTLPLPQIRQLKTPKTPDMLAKLIDSASIEHLMADYPVACQAMKNQALYATRQLAKRQYTWMRRWANVSDKADFRSVASQPAKAQFDVSGLPNVDGQQLTTSSIVDSPLRVFARSVEVKHHINQLL